MIFKKEPVNTISILEYIETKLNGIFDISSDDHELADMGIIDECFGVAEGNLQRKFQFLPGISPIPEL